MATSEPDPENTSVAGFDGAPPGSVPFGLVMAGAFAWRAIVIGVVIVFAFTFFAALSPILVPLIIALIIAAPLERLVTRLQRARIPRGGGAAIVLLSLTFVVLALIGIAGGSIVAGFDDLKQAALEGFDQFLVWLADGPLNVAQERIDNITEQVQGLLTDNWVGVANGALAVTGTIGALFAGAAIALVALFFYLRDGRGMWLWAIKSVGGKHEARIDSAGQHAWITLRRYAQTSAFVAFIDALGIGLGAWILGIPLAFPIAIMVFLFSFIPLFGAALSGAVAILVALVDGGWTTALIMLGIVIVVQQIEGSVLYPWLFGKAASLHPMVILVTVSAGTLLAGLVGAVVAVPLVAFGTAFVVGLRREIIDESLPISQQLPLLRAKSRNLVHRRKPRAGGTAKPESSDPGKPESSDD